MKVCSSKPSPVRRPPVCHKGPPQAGGPYPWPPTDLYANIQVRTQANFPGGQNIFDVSGRLRGEGDRLVRTFWEAYVYEIVATWDYFPWIERFRLVVHGNIDGYWIGGHYFADLELNPVDPPDTGYMTNVSSGGQVTVVARVTL